MSVVSVLVIRDPEWENEYVVEGGEVETIDVDLGRSFDGPKGFDATSADAQDWIEELRERVAHLPADGPIRERVEALITHLTGEQS